MNKCTNPYCHSVTTYIYVDNGWNRVCPVCGRREMLPAGRRPAPTEADKRAGMGYIQAMDLEYAEAETLFREAYLASKDDDLRASYIWWAVKCCYGIEYVEEVLYKDDPERRTKQYTPIIARLPFNVDAVKGCETLSLFRQYLRENPSLEMRRMFSEMENLYAETDEAMRARENQCEVFIAWHDSHNGQCFEFAQALEGELIRNKRDCFFSARTLADKAVTQFPAYIYTALATARVFVIVIDDYDALGKQFLAWEIRRMQRRRLIDRSVQIIFNGMSGHTGVIPEFMATQQRHYEDSEVNRDRIKLVSRDVSDVLDGLRGGQKPLKDKTVKLEPVNPGDFDYTIAGSAVTVTGYRGSTARLDIPDRIAGKPVACIGENAFRNHAELTEVNLPNTVTSIGDCAFLGCGNLRSVAHRDSITSIGKGAFALCASLTSFAIPSRLTRIADSTFSGCSRLISIVIPNAVTFIDQRAFKNCASMTSITIPHTVHAIGRRAFDGCCGLQSIRLPDGLTKISEGTFYGCSGLKEVTIPDAVTCIEWLAFCGCSDLLRIDIPNNVTQIGSDVFKDCICLTEIRVSKALVKACPRAFVGFEHYLVYKRKWR